MAEATSRLTEWPDIGVRPTVPALLAMAAETHGEADYVVTLEDRLSFAEAQRRSCALAKRLLADGVGKGTRVGIVLPTGIHSTVAFLAATRIGAIAVLFSTTYRAAELRRAVRLADVHLLIAPRVLLGRGYEDHLEDTFEGLAEATAGPYRLPSMPYLRAIWVVGGSSRAWATSVDPFDLSDHGISDDLLAAVEAEVMPADPMVGIWTSGSSADPKGVIHTHGAAVRKMSTMIALGIPDIYNPGSRIFMAMPFFWVGGPQCTLGCLFSGNRMVTQERFEPVEALELIERERCTSVAGFATMAEALRAHPEFQRRDTSSLVDPPANPMFVVSSKGHVNNFGMTETFGPNGPLLFEYKVIDRDTGALLPDGEEGEFCVRGLALMHSLYKREREETVDADGYYHTGDRGYIEDGRIFFTGRYSEMIKAGGANVSPLEVEGVLTSFPEVRLAFVFGVPHPTRGEEVVGLVVPEDGMEIDLDIGDRAKKLLSSYKVPTTLEVVDFDTVPWLATGKPDKRSMQAAFLARQEAAGLAEPR